MKRIKNFESFTEMSLDEFVSSMNETKAVEPQLIKEGAIKRLTQEIVDHAVSEKDNWLWQGGTVEDFIESDDRHDFVMNAIDDFADKYYAEDSTYGFIQENKEGIVSQIVLALEHEYSL